MWRQLVDQLGPQVLDHGAFRPKWVHALNTEHAFAEAFKFGLHRDLAADDAGLIDAWRFLAIA
jgi:hypothetical protein